MYDNADLATQPPVAGPRETLAESHWNRSQQPAGREPAASPAQLPVYPHTDPATYRDPLYEVPITANRTQDTAR